MSVRGEMCLWVRKNIVSYHIIAKWFAFSIV